MGEPSISNDETALSGVFSHVGKEVVSLSRDAALVNRLVNHPEIRPFIGGEGHIDLSDAVARWENWFLLGDHGGFALIWSAPGVHEVHTFILRSGRGAWAMKAAADGIAYAAHRGDRMLWTKIPYDQPNVRRFAANMGMGKVGYDIETLGKPYSIYKMEIGPCRLPQ